MAAESATTLPRSAGCSATCMAPPQPVRLADKGDASTLQMAGAADQSETASDGVARRPQVPKRLTRNAAWATAVAYCNDARAQQRTGRGCEPERGARVA